MPELPEVETIVNGLHVEFKDKKLEKIELSDPTLLRNVSGEELQERLAGKRLERVTRRGKYIVLEFSDEDLVAIHLRMSGRLLSLAPGDRADHERISFYFADHDRKITMDNTRRLGTLDLLGSLEEEPFDSLGLEPFADEYNWENFNEIFSTTRPVKVLLLDQDRITGLGNIYVSEILFRAGLDPTTPGEEVSQEDRKSLFKLIPRVLTEAINNKGTTLNDYQDSSGKRGNFQDFLRVYGKEGDPCPNCGSEIVRIEQGGRSTFLCPSCQNRSED
ncbi:MAG: bifunctional DNA-formamidopyrimidine glycosylase/DNA-(apurinic or apyrimidinic site) lyase [Candidatus Bipolaricaulota bacterium]